ncbi:MAG: hypothetical protein KJ063_01970 [Anaerolineae bacterium]|nr:hypothetical protein [Anaerolineae bacterium]
MDNQPNQSKYTVINPVQSAVGDYANVNNFLPAKTAAIDSGTAELRRLFEEINRYLEALNPADREMIAPAVAQTVKVTAEIQQGDESEEKQTFLATRLKNLHTMAPDIAQVIITTLASPVAGIALTIQKIAQKAQADLKE